MIVASISCTENAGKSEVTSIEIDLETSLTEKEALQEKGSLVGTWIVKELLVNGKPDPENYPVHSHELTFHQDMSLISRDTTFNVEGKGTWERISNEQFAVVTEDERVVFKILILTDTVLETKMLTDKIDMVINYIKEK